MHLTLPPTNKNIGFCFALYCVALCNSVLAQPAAVPAQTLRIVGGIGGLHQYSRNEEPFWSKELARLSGGKYSAEIVPFDRAGVPGPEMLRLMQYGVVPFGTALLSNIATQTAELAAPDLAGLNPDIASLRKNLAAYRPYIEKTLRERHGVELLAVYVYPAQVIFCKKPLKALNDLAGRRVRVSSATQADFVGALGATPVQMGLPQITANMVSGNVECAITGSMSGNTLGLFEHSNYLHTLPITWGLAVFAANTTAWRALPGDLRALLSHEIPKLEAAIWAESERETADGIACNQGLPSCQAGRKAFMTVVSATAQDQAQRMELLKSTVLPRWLQRCGAGCSAIWNQTIGISSGLLIPSSP
jgi:TRAP-type C4-dicarboxylate transport system substrate-binding protein